MKRRSLTVDKILYTLMIVCIYAIARSIPLYGIDVHLLFESKLDADKLIMQTISGDLNKCSILALGIMPYMLASLPVSIIASCRSADAKAHTSQITMNRLVVGIMFVMAVLLAVFRLEDITFIGEGYVLVLQKITAVIQMVTGAFVILILSERNKRYGIGGQTALIYINILDGIMSNIMSHTSSQLRIPIIIAAIGFLVIICLENTEKRIPMQRISIHNIYGDKDYQAIKLNPIGIMPVMFASAFSILPQLIVKILLIFFPNSTWMNWFVDNAVLTRPLGIGIYIGVLYFLTIFFSFVFLNPTELSEQLLKSGDSMVGIHVGRDSLRYIRKNVIVISIFSATIMSIFMGLPLLMQLSNQIDSSLVMFPSSIMMLTGLWSNLFQEFRGVRDLDAYKPFI